MAFRHFVDDRGRFWCVWDVYPGQLETRRLTDVGPPAAQRERRRLAQYLATLSPDMARGWLAFEAHDGERRRLTPIPTLDSHWSGASEDQLSFWCEMSQLVPSFRQPR